jgi:hypothetical protein
MAFIFQACYGTGGDLYAPDVRLTGTVKSETTKLPVKGIKITIDGKEFSDEGYYNNNYGITDKDGNFDFYVYLPYWYYANYNIQPKVKIQFLDIDGTENGYFADKTITVERKYEYKHRYEIKINVELEEKQ